MAGDPSKRNQNLYCAYHQEPGHTTDDCRNLKNHLDRLVREGKLRHLLHRPEGWREQSNIETRQSTLRPPIDTINVILAAPGRTGSSPFRVMSVGRFSTEPDDRESKRARVIATPLIGFSEEDKQGTLQPHDDALVVTLRIGGYDVKRVLVDQGSAVEVMYPDLYKELNLKPEDLSPYDSPLVSFEGKTVTPKGMIRLPVQTDLDVVEVNFIVVDAYSPYTAIVARPWLHALGAMPSTLHQKVKYPSGGQSADYTGRIAKWGTILGAFDIRYMPRTAVKGQVLADLVAEFAEPILEGGGGSLNPDGKLISAITQQEPS
ncbi:uncharacterized protein LOC126691157 [Quercus robur]|uniref:uncharacterized protein LOC126691157 n=1 Tax=Quercus robur TaxID=38942 RepID=UPI002163E40C|nr:uncharacterized protein LOC126691157 [Quercus robur]